LGSHSPKIPLALGDHLLLAVARRGGDNECAGRDRFHSFDSRRTSSSHAAWLTRLLKISEFRQAWINALRDDLAAYLGATQKWFHAYSRGEEEWKLFSMGNEASVILYRIKLRFNPNENKFKQQDDDFLAALDEIKNPSVIAAGVDRVTLGQRISKDNVASKSNPQKGVGNNKAVLHLAMDAAKLSMWLDW
jgi:hypothetical protein